MAKISLDQTDDQINAAVPTADPYSRQSYNANPIYGQYQNRGHGGMNYQTGRYQYTANAPIDQKRTEDALMHYAGIGDREGLNAWMRANRPGARSPENVTWERFRIKALGQNLNREADDFKNNLDNYAGDQYGLLKKDVEQGLSQGIDQTRKNYSSRGLLYSGLRQGAESKQRGQAASQLAQGRAGINSDLMSMAVAKKKTAAQVGLATFEQAQAQASELSNLQMQNAIARRRNAQQLGQGLGYAAGAYYGNQSTDRKDPTSGIISRNSDYDYYDATGNSNGLINS
jgi:hypothetical protein